MRIHIALVDDCWDVLAESLKLDVESAFVAVLAIAMDEERTTVLVRELLPVPDDCYIERSRSHLLISSSGFMPGFGRAATAGAAVGFVHTHPGGRPAFSKLDDAVDGALAPVAFLRTGASLYVSLVAAGEASQPRCEARVVDREGRAHTVELVRAVGQRTDFFLRSGAGAAGDVDRFDRQIRAFGKDGQALLGALRVGVVGAGGTGSAVCEQLARLGVGEIVVSDDDVVNASNVSRIFGSGAADTGRLKVDVVADEVVRIGGETRVTTFGRKVTDAVVARAFRHCDFLFGCTDDQSGRAVLARLAYWYLIPLLDVGVIVQSDSGRVTDVVGRVTYVGPGAPCLLCRKRIDPAVVAAEGLPAEERRRLASEGYVQGLGEPDPAVVGYTTLVAATAVSEFLHSVIGLAPKVPGSEILLRIADREVRVNEAQGRPGHYCMTRSGWGAGDVEPFLGMVWTA